MHGIQLCGADGSFLNGRLSFLIDDVFHQPSTRAFSKTEEVSWTKSKQAALDSKSSVNSRRESAQKTQVTSQIPTFLFFWNISHPSFQTLASALFLHSHGYAFFVMCEVVLIGAWWWEKPRGAKVVTLVRQPSR